MIVHRISRTLTIALVMVGLSSARPGKKNVDILWRNPGRVESLDLANGVGGAAKAPRAPFHFLEEDPSGSNPKIKLRDARGAEWSLKWGEEAKPEVFASRLAWACGYVAQPEYFVRGGRILGVKRLARPRW